VFYKQSYADSSVQDVADELGILKGSLYYYIKTKEDLLVWLLDDVHDDVERILQGVTARTDLGPLQRLDLYVREQVLYNARNLPRISVYHHDAEQLSPAPLKALQQRRRVHDQVVVDMIKEAQERGEISSEFDARVLSNCVFATMIWVYRWYRPNGRLKQEDLADVCARFALAGVTGVANPSVLPA
jgi:AcrR family transcriptional regulator